MPLDYSGQNLQGRSFKGQNLAGANFSYADIRGADFTSAKLRGANFSHAKAGLQPFWVIFLVILSLLLSTVSGCLSAIAGVFLLTSFLPEIVNEYTIIPGVILSIILTIFVVTSIYRGLGAVSVAMVVAGAIAVAFAALVTAEFPGLGAGAVAFAVAMAGTVAGAIAGAFSIAGAIVVTFARAAVVLVALAIAVVAAVAFANNAVVPGTVTVAVILTSLSSYIAWRALAGDEKYSFVRNIAVTFAATGGTSFQKVDLTDASFTEAILKSTNLRGANITCTSWFHSQRLDFACFGESYLKNPQLRQLLTLGNGQDQNFDRLDLRGLNLRGANLENASFIDADFYKANLQAANLSRSKLVRAQFERSDLRGACLTGSCIQDWVISRDTKLDGIICDYAYLKWIDGDKRDQMPPRGKFTEGGFVTFVRYILETVELYHEKDINPRLALTVLQKMSGDYDEPLDIVALGKKGERVFIQVKVSENIIRENFKEDYYSRYDTDLKLWSGNIHQLPPTVNSFIEKRIHEIVSEKTDDFVFVNANYVEGNYAEIYQGEVNMSGDRTINMDSGNYNERIEGNYVQGDYREGKQSHFNLQGAQFAGGLVNADTVNAHQIGGNITNDNSELTQAAAQIQQLLEQLEQTYKSNTTTGKMAIATEAIKVIESDRTLAQRVLSALKVGGTEALAQLLNHPAASFVIGALDDWQKTKGS